MAHRKQNLSTGAIVAIAVAGVVLVPVAIVSVYAARKAKRVDVPVEPVPTLIYTPPFRPGLEPTPWEPIG